MENNSFYSKIVGSSFCNGQKIIPTLKSGDTLILKREPENKFDTNAIAVEVPGKERIGYIPKDTAAGLAPEMDNGVKVKCEVSEITGLDKPNQGCNILITKLN